MINKLIILNLFINLQIKNSFFFQENFFLFIGMETNRGFRNSGIS